MALRTGTLVLWVSALAGLATLLVSVLETFSFGFRSPTVHVAIETAASIVAVVAAYLVLGRFRSTRRLEDLALFTALAMLSATNVAFSTTLALTGYEQGSFATWAPLAGRVLAALAFAASAFAPDRRIESPRRGAAAAIAGVAALAAIAALVGLLGSGFSTGIDPDLSPASSDHPRIVGSPGLLALQLLTMAAYATAAVGFTRRAARARDDLIAWFAIGTTLAAFSRLNYFLFPSVFSNYVFTGDLLRLCFYLALLVGALRAIATYQRAAATAAVVGERRRMARELHDGLAQELAYIRMQSNRLAATHGEPALEQLAVAAERALDESRGAISTLAEGERTVADDLLAAAQSVANRAGASARLGGDRDVRLPHDARFALVRIVREAVSNAVRHGHAREVSLLLGADEGEVRLVIADDGCGFDVEAAERTRLARAATGGPAAGGGFGLTSMRERVELLGGSLHLESAPGDGTIVEVRLPLRRARAARG